MHLPPSFSLAASPERLFLFLVLSTFPVVQFTLSSLSKGRLKVISLLLIGRRYQDEDGSGFKYLHSLLSVQLDELIVSTAQDEHTGQRVFKIEKCVGVQVSFSSEIFIRNLSCASQQVNRVRRPQGEEEKEEEEDARGTGASAPSAKVGILLSILHVCECMCVCS